MEDIVLTQVPATVAPISDVGIGLICLTLLLLFVLFVTRKRITGVIVNRGGIQISAGDGALILDLHHRLEPIDHKCMTQIASQTDLIDIVEPSRSDTIKTVLINQLARDTLTLSAFSNHHARELCENYTGYGERKMAAILAKLGRYRHLLDPDMPDVKVIGSYVTRWLHVVVIPPVLTACQRKIEYYQGLLTRPNISGELKDNVRAWLKKNEGYVAKLTSVADEISSSSNILNESKITTLGNCPSCTTLADHDTY